MAKQILTPQIRGTPETSPCGRPPSPGNPPGLPPNALRTQQALPEDAQVRLLSLCYSSSVKGGLSEEIDVSTRSSLMLISRSREGQSSS